MSAGKNRRVSRVEITGGALLWVWDSDCALRILGGGGMYVWKIGGFYILRVRF